MALKNRRRIRKVKRGKHSKLSIGWVVWGFEVIVPTLFPYVLNILTQLNTPDPIDYFAPISHGEILLWAAAINFFSMFKIYHINRNTPANNTDPRAEALFYGSLWCSATWSWLYGFFCGYPKPNPWILSLLSIGAFIAASTISYRIEKRANGGEKNENK